MNLDLKKYYEKQTDYFLDSAESMARKGYVRSVFSFLNQSKGFAKAHSKDLLDSVKKKERTIINKAYEKGIEFKLNGVKEAIRIKGGKDDLKSILILNAYNWLNDAIDYSQEIGKDIKRKSNKLLEQLNALGLQEYLTT